MTPNRFLLDGERVTLSEAAERLGVGVATVMRHVGGNRIDAEAIRALAPMECVRRPTQGPTRSPRPYRGPAHFHDDVRRPGAGRRSNRDRNARIIARIAEAFEARP